MANNDAKGDKMEPLMTSCRPLDDRFRPSSLWVDASVIETSSSVQVIQRLKEGFGSKKNDGCENYCRSDPHHQGKPPVQGGTAHSQ
jgi:hypothetical protein